MFIIFLKNIAIIYNNGGVNVDYNNNSSENNSWESGIRFVEEKKPRRIARFLSLVMVVFFSGSIGGIIGGYYVKNNYIPETTGVINNQVSSSSAVQTANLPQTSIGKVADIVSPAVVGVTNYAENWGFGSSWGGTSENGTGSGIIFDSKGYIVTNYHVIDGAQKVTVTLPGGKKVNAKIIGGDEAVDLAVLKIDEIQNLPVAKFGDSSKVRVGDTAIAIGNPLGEEFAGSVTSGIISALNREITMNGEANKYIQTDASINPGNSGGALCNAAGEVIGINSIKVGSAEGMGFAIPINTAKPIIEELISKGKVSRPYLGIGYIFIDQYSARDWNVPVGVGIKSITKNSPAQQAGLQADDIIVAFDGTEIKDENTLKNLLKNHKVGDEVSAKVWRDSKYIEVRIKLGDSANY